MTTSAAHVKLTLIRQPKHARCLLTILLLKTTIHKIPCCLTSHCSLIKRLVTFGDQGATLSSHNPPHITTSSKQNQTLFLLKEESNPGEPQPLDNGGYQTAQHSWVQMTHFTRPWSQHIHKHTHTRTHTRARAPSYRYTHDPKGPVLRQGCSNHQEIEGSSGVVRREGEGTTQRKGNCTAHEGGGWKWPMVFIFIYLKVLI